jgi:hypothetical protein
MPILATESISTGPFVTEVGTDSAFKMPNADDKSVLTRVIPNHLDSYMLKNNSTAMYEDISDVNVRVPAISQVSKVSEGALAAVLQIWEGTVVSVNAEKQVMSVKLTDRAGLIPTHTGDIDLEWVAPQDMDLVKPGAVFYWTIYKETKRGTIKNSEEIQFRRLPNWTKKQVEQLYKDADAFLAAFAN